MSTYFSVYDCQRCGHRETVGFVGERNDCLLYCASCQRRCYLVPPAGETLLETSLSHEIMAFPEATVPKKHRTKRNSNRNASLWIKTGIEVPIEEGLREIAGEIFLTYTPNWKSVACPYCHQHGTLSDYRTYLQHCPACRSDKMSESDL